MLISVLTAIIVSLTAYKPICQRLYMGFVVFIELIIIDFWS